MEYLQITQNLQKKQENYILSDEKVEAFSALMQLMLNHTCKHGEYLLTLQGKNAKKYKDEIKQYKGMKIFLAKNDIKKILNIFVKFIAPLYCDKKIFDKETNEIYKPDQTIYKIGADLYHLFYFTVEQDMMKLNVDNCEEVFNSAKAKKNIIGQLNTSEEMQFIQNTNYKMNIINKKNILHLGHCDWHRDNNDFMKSFNPLPFSQILNVLGVEIKNQQFSCCYIKRIALLMEEYGEMSWAAKEPIVSFLIKNKEDLLYRYEKIMEHNTEHVKIVNEKNPIAGVEVQQKTIERLSSSLNFLPFLRIILNKKLTNELSNLEVTVASEIFPQTEYEAGKKEENFEIYLENNKEDIKKKFNDYLKSGEEAKLFHTKEIEKQNNLSKEELLNKLREAKKGAGRQTRK